MEPEYKALERFNVSPHLADRTLEKSAYCGAGNSQVAEKDLRKMRARKLRSDHCSAMITGLHQCNNSQRHTNLDSQIKLVLCKLRECGRSPANCGPHFAGAEIALLGFHIIQESIDHKLSFMYLIQKTSIVELKLH